MNVISGAGHDAVYLARVAPTPLAAFGRNGPDWGDDAYRANHGMRTAMAAFLDAAAREGADIVTPVSAAANPSGPVAAGAYAAICDAVMLDLHGAMVAEQSADGEGDLLARVRAVLPDAPIAVALDLHANVTQKMIDHADVIVSFKTYPHVDMYETGEHAARLLLDRLHGRARFLLLKSRMYCRPVFVPIAAALVECDSRGVTGSDFGQFDYARLARPVFPLDAGAGWHGR
ncbi:M81 family metallopeptidase [Burkholderia anthina]|nr:M81 family metallopeptidase [Burkholderia anthina]QTD94769.1 M81 family metallopeptidase [Burkholderia anthina]